MPLILTLKIDDESFQLFDQLRRLYFPSARNFLAAHVTLFHHLPDENLARIKTDLNFLCAETQPFAIEFCRWRFLGKGSAMSIESPPLIEIRRKLSALWQADLTAQDRQKYQPHITIQNKVASFEARKLFEELTAEWKSKNGAAHGLTLWHYAGGPWRFEEEFLFAV